MRASVLRVGRSNTERPGRLGRPHEGWVFAPPCVSLCPNPRHACCWHGLSCGYPTPCGGTSWEPLPPHCPPRDSTYASSRQPPSPTASPSEASLGLTQGCVCA